MREHFPGTLALMDTDFFTFCLILVKRIEKHLARLGFELVTYMSEGKCDNRHTMGP